MHLFLFKPGYWLGEGKVTFSASPEEITFYTRWAISDKEKNEIHCLQQVEMQGVDDQVVNRFVFSDVTATGFQAQLTNDLLGVVQGKGIYDDKQIGWEFRGHPNFEGFELYKLESNGEYTLHAEYASPDQFRTVIQGRIWPRAYLQE